MAQAGGITGGVVVRIDTAGAIVAQKELKGATDAVFVSLTNQDKAIKSIETSMGKFSGTTERVFTQVTGSALVLPAHFQKTTAEVDKSGASANKAASFFQKLIGATGATGAAKTFGILTTGARALYGSLNPLGIAVGFVAGALVQMVSELAGAETALEKVRAKSVQSAKDFSALGLARSRTSQAVGSIELPTTGGVGRTLEQDADAIEAAMRQLVEADKRLREAGKLFDERQPFFGKQDRDLQLGASEIQDLAEALKFPPEFFRGLDKVQELGDELMELRDFQARQRDPLFAGIVPTEAELARVQELEKQLGALNELTKRGVELTPKKSFLGTYSATDIAMSAANANKLLTEEYLKQEAALDKVNKQIRERSEKENIGEIGRARAHQERIFLEDQRFGPLGDLRDIGPLEQQAIAKVRSIEEKLRDDKIRPRGFTDKEKSLADEWVASARALDQYNDSLRQTVEIGRDVGGNIGGAFAEAAFQAGEFDKNLQKAFLRLAEASTQRLLAELFAALGGAVARSVFGPSQPTTNVVGETRRSTGGVESLYPTMYAATGMLLDRWGMVSYGQRNVGVAEGGGSTPEAIMPLQRDRQGRLGVTMAETGPQNFFDFSGMRTAAEVQRARPTAIQMAGEMQRMQGKYNGAGRARTR